MNDGSSRKARRLPFVNGTGLESPVKTTGWDSYHGGIGRLGRDRSRRKGPSTVYTWQGYQAWAARVRAKWDPEQS
jgi:hypothetical protein